jgi:hypothetical protein
LPHSGDNDTRGCMSVELGTLIAASGVLLIVDPGYLENIAIVRLSEFAAMDKRVDALLDEAPGSVFERVRARRSSGG